MKCCLQWVYVIVNHKHSHIYNHFSFSKMIKDLNKQTYFLCLPFAHSVKPQTLNLSLNEIRSVLRITLLIKCVLKSKNEPVYQDITSSFMFYTSAHVSFHAFFSCLFTIGKGNVMKKFLAWWKWHFLPIGGCWKLAHE